MKPRLTQAQQRLLSRIPKQGVLISATEGMRQVHTANALAGRGLITKTEAAVPFTWFLKRVPS